jgi:short-subunit dehydrogenase
MQTLANKTAFVTGAASGIGLAIARELAGSQCHLHLVDVDSDGLNRVAEELGGGDVQVWTHACDVTAPDQIDATVDAALSAAGEIDVLINNAGVAYYGPTHMMTQQQWDWLMAVNLLAPIRITNRLLPHLLERPDAHIVNMCSISGLVAGGRFSAYHTSKFGLIGFTESLRAEYGRRGLGVSAICPGPVRTNLYDSAASGSADKRVPHPPSFVCASAETVARRTLKAIKRNQRQVLITPMAHGLYQLKRFAPWLIDFANQFSRKKKKRRQARIAALEAANSEASRQAETLQANENSSDKRAA